MSSLQQQSAALQFCKPCLRRLQVLALERLLLVTTEQPTDAQPPPRAALSALRPVNEAPAGRGLKRRAEQHPGGQDTVCPVLL